MRKKIEGGGWSQPMPPNRLTEINPNPNLQLCI